MIAAQSTTQRTRYARERGFTLVELMVGIAVGLMVLAALTLLFVSTSAHRRDMERTGRQIENGRYAMQLIDDELVNAGYFGELDPRTVGAPGARPDPCSTNLDDLKIAVLMHIQGFEAAAIKPSCLADVRSNTDVIAVRRTATCVAGSANCDAPAAGEIYLQSSLCNTELANPIVANRYAVAVQPSSGPSPYSLTIRDCATPAVLRSYVVRIYFIANNNNPGDGIPTLKRADLTSAGFSIVPLVEGIEDLQVEYGIDTNNDGIPDASTVDPGQYGGCASDPCYIANWINTMTAKVHVLSRTTDVTLGYQDTKTYHMGLDGDDATPLVVGPFNDAFKRHAYTQMIRLTNPAGRRE